MFDSLLALISPAAGSGYGDCLALFFAGALLCNCVPHLVSGLQGLPFPTPFATPHGVGDSAPLVNVLWGFVNLLAGADLLVRHPAPPGANLDIVALVAGAMGIGVFAARHFGAVQRARRAA